MTAVFGASLGVSGIHGISFDLSTAPPTSTESFARPPIDAQDQWRAVTSAVGTLAHASTTPVLALRDKNPTEAYGVEYVGGLALVTDLGAQIGALQESGDLADEQTIVLFDVGAGGVTVSIVDRESGRVHLSRRSTVLSGDGCDAALTRFLLERHPSWSPRAPEEDHRFVEQVCAAKEELSGVTAVAVRAPFGPETAWLHRSDLDDLVRENVRDAVTLAESMIAGAARVDALFAVGGGANMQIVRQSLFDAVSVPVFVPVDPQLLAAKGAAGTARAIFAGPARARAGGGPRHSDSSSKRLARLTRSRYLGGAVAVLVAGGVATSIAAAASGDDAATSVVETRPATSTSNPSPAMTAVQAPPVTEVQVPPVSAASSSETTTPAPIPSSADRVATMPTTTAVPKTTTKRVPDPTTTTVERTTQEPTTTRTREPASSSPSPATSSSATRTSSTSPKPTSSPG
ncbi:Hsp70 family protein [Rhodococcoides yunnanense]|uniref:Hsp70 family protein n=1 Tax=Rhodococcoides yunnanense TaxID=278209 RepID=UPI00093268BB|nr:Hsp70 family protein [Rhodococcus yunnanensis]